VQSALADIDGVSDVKVSLADNNAVVKIQKGKVTTADLTAAVSGAGFSAKAAN
jgi:copper chaperone CopZ